MDDELSLIRSLLEDIQDPLEIVSPAAVQAEREVAERAQETQPVVEPLVTGMTSTEVSPARPAAAETAGVTRSPDVSPTEREGLSPASVQVDAVPKQALPQTTATERHPDSVRPVQVSETGTVSPQQVQEVLQGVSAPKPVVPSIPGRLEPEQTSEPDRLVQPAPVAEVPDTETVRPLDPRESVRGFVKAEPVDVSEPERRSPPVANTDKPTPGSVKHPSWAFRERTESPEASPVRTGRTENPNVEVADPLRFAAGVVTASEREHSPPKMTSPITGAQVSVKQVNPNIRIETVIPDSFPLDARSMFAMVDKELNIPVVPGGNPRYAELVQLPPITVGDSTEQAVARHYASTQGILDFDQRNTIE
jgi:hypothetical protein